MIQSKTAASANAGIHSTTSRMSSSLPLRSLVRQTSDLGDSSQITQTLQARPKLAVDTNSSALASTLLKRVDNWTFEQPTPVGVPSILEKLRRHNDVLVDQTRSLKQGYGNDREMFDAGRKQLLQQIKWLMDDLDLKRVEIEDDSVSGEDRGWATV